MATGVKVEARLLLAGMLLGWSSGAMPEGRGSEDRRLRTYANPIDLPYRYQDLKELYQQASASVIYREAADPTVVRFHGRYWLFPSHSKGYWHSIDLLHWTFVEATGYDTGKYAPTVAEIDGKLYLAAGDRATAIWVSDDPMTGRWREAAKIAGYDDPCLFLDDDGRLYMYHGLSGKDVLQVDELDRTTFAPLRHAVVPASRDKEARGWEVPGDTNQLTNEQSYIEGSWMTKFRGRYYLQYAAPGTQYKTYADGVLVADKPMGPFVYQRYNPFSIKPTGFIAGAGHGSTFRDADGRWWHAATMSISSRFRFERRLGMFPASFTSRRELIADTYLGDYPRYVDGNRELTGWMLLSRHKPAIASSALASHPAEAAADEDVRTWWSASSGEPGEWLTIDLGGVKRIDAVQINFADQDSRGRGISRDVYRYVLELSDDGRGWRVAVNRSNEGRDAPHDYEVLAKPEQARFVRLRNIHVPDGGKFSLYDMRVFGSGGGAAPAKVDRASIVRDPADPRRALISWQPSRGAEFYIVRLGATQETMNQSYQVYDGQHSVPVASLNVGASYVVAVDALNENGIATWTSKPVGLPAAASAPR